MPLAVNTNTAAMQASFNLGRANDAEGLAVATKINSKARRTQTTQANQLTNIALTLLS